MRTRLRTIGRAAATGAAAGAVLGIALVTAALLWPLPSRLDREDSTVVEYRDGTAAHVFLSADDKWRIDPDLDAIDPAYRRALVALEDERFWSHPGVDPVAVVRAAASNLRHGRVVSGASTITMQLVRLLEPRPRTFRSKVVESFRALQLELHYSKREILEHYLRFAPYGRNIEGLPAAAHAYFGHAADDLSPNEIATLLAVPQNPTDHSPAPENRGRLEAARNAIVETLREDGSLPGDSSTPSPAPDRLAERIRREPVPSKLLEFPREIPHAAYWLRARRPDAERIETTIDPSTQETVRQYVETYRRRSRVREIFNSAVVVLEHETGAVRAISGNFDFYVDDHGGQIPGFAVPRSTGSLLKPFLYASAVDRGLAGPRHLVRDTPVRYGEYRPENYSGTFSGLVRLEEALAQSLNVPFVNLANEVGVGAFLGTLRHLGAPPLHARPGHYGLTAAVGGVSLTPLEAAGAYGALARGGRPVPVRLGPGLRATDPLDDRIFSRGTTWLTRRALSRRDRPDFPSRSRFTGTPPTVAWKTGTSAGKRDAWTAGYGPDHTIVVWMGNFDNESSPALVGSEASAPLFFDLIEAIDSPRDALPSPPDRALTEVEVCAYSGHLPTEACPHTERALLPTRSVPTEQCPYHVRAKVDPASGKLVTPECRPPDAWETKTFVAWPRGVQRWMTDRGAEVPHMPAYAEGCRPNRPGAPPEIVSPPEDADLVLVPGMPAERQQVPLAANTAVGGEVNWFVDGEFVGSSPGDRRLWWTPREGTHRLTVVDARGRRASRRLQVH